MDNENLTRPAIDTSESYWMTFYENLTLSQYQGKDLEIGEGGYVSPSPPLQFFPLSPFHSTSTLCPLFYFSLPSPSIALSPLSPYSPPLLDLRWGLWRARISKIRGLGRSGEGLQDQGRGARGGVGLAEMFPSLATPSSR